jgi:hypothetical protein
MTFPSLMLDEQESSAHSIEFSSEYGANILQIRKYLAIIFEVVACRYMNK